ncbi:MAG: metallopeptidase family protein [Bacillota bacterium]|nr:metallopeptidase family protein [Bacillota bacterium]
MSFPTIDEVHDMLDTIAEGIPQAIFKELNKGIVLLPQVKLHPESDPSQVLYILGEYTSNRTGRQIVLYYGSFRQSFPGRSRERLYKELKNTLYHEFVHHLEGLAGDYDLEVEDRISLERYKQRLRSAQESKGE